MTPDMIRELLWVALHAIPAIRHMVATTTYEYEEYLP